MVNFNKTGIIVTSRDTVNPNLIKGNYHVTTTSTTHVPTGSATAPGIEDIIVANQGKKLWFSFDYSTEGERNENTGRSGTLGARYGAHLSFRYYKTDGTLDTQRYPCASYLTMSGTGRAVMSYTLPTDIQSVHTFGVSLQPFAGPASGNDATWYLKNFKLEIGDNATPWIPHVEDWGYIESNHGFIEDGDLMKVFENRINTGEFIEY